MRILINTTSLSPGAGTELHALQVGRELALRGHDIDVVSQREGVQRQEYEEFAGSVSVCGDFLHNPLSPVHLRQPVRLVKWIIALCRAVRTSRRLHPDVIYANTPQALMWAWATSAGSGTPIVCHLHEVVGNPIGRQRAFLAKRVKVFIVPSAFVGDDWVRCGLPAELVEVIPQAIDPSAYPPASRQSRDSARKTFEFPPDAFVVLYLGRVVPDKGVEILVRAWRTLSLDSEEGHLLVVGPSWPPEYAGYLKELGPPNCLFVRMVSDVLPILYAADLLVLPSLVEEAFGRVIIEAMATGCPVVASDVGGIPEVLNGEFSSMLFERGNQEELTARLSELRHWRRDDPGLAGRCVAHVAKSFDLASAVDKIERALEPAQGSR